MKRKVDKFVSQLREGTTICSGGAVGIDKWAEESAHNRGFRFVGFYPEEDDETTYVEACFRRNTQIADWVAVNGGTLIAFIDPMSSRGSNDTIRKLKRYGGNWIVYEYDIDGKEVKHSTNIEGLFD